MINEQEKKKQPTFLSVLLVKSVWFFKKEEEKKKKLHRMKSIAYITHTMWTLVKNCYYQSYHTNTAKKGGHLKTIEPPLNNNAIIASFT